MLTSKTEYPFGGTFIKREQGKFVMRDFHMV